ncbi:MAG: DUF4233 domain-containing protein [Actinomycetes bacterium]
MRTLCASVLAFEALVVALAIVPALTLTDAHHTLIVVGGLTVVVLCVLAAAMLRSPNGYVLGSAVQVLVVAGGFVLPVMFFLGGLFALLWISAILVARRAEVVLAAKRAAAQGPGVAPGPPAPPDAG